MNIKDLYIAFKNAYTECNANNIASEKKIDNIRDRIYCISIIIDKLGILEKTLRDLRFHMPIYERQNYIVPLVDVLENGSCKLDYNSEGNLCKSRYVTTPNLKQLYNELKRELDYRLENMKRAYKERNYELVEKHFNECENCYNSFYNNINRDLLQEAMDRYQSVFGKIEK